MSVDILKKIGKEITTPLTLVLNNCLLEGIFPSEMKLSKVIPIFKKGNQLLAENYRPVSILPVFSKILESLIKRRISNF